MPHLTALNTQKGAVTLPVALIIVLLLTIVTIYSARVGILETRTSANKIRSQEALAGGELGVETALAYIQKNESLVADNSNVTGWANSSSTIHWVQCTSGATTKPCSLINSTMRDRWMYLVNNTSADLTSLLKVTTSCTDSDVNGICDSNTSQYSQVAGNYDYLYIMSRCRDLNNDGDCSDTNESATRPMAYPTLTVFAEGVSADGTATSPVQQSAYFYQGSSNLSDFPASIMAAGSVGSSGTFNVVVNPDANGTVGNRPLSFWTKQDVTFGSASSATCYEGDVGVNGFLGTTSSADSTQTATYSGGTVTVKLCRTCACPNNVADGAISNNSTTHEVDILDVDNNTGKWLDASFPSDVFKYVTSYATSDYMSFKSMMIAKGEMTEITDCGSLNTSSGGWYWFTGSECSISSDVGSLANPVLLISQGNFKMSANNYFFGMIFAFDPNGATLNVTLNGGPTVYGILVSNTSISLSNGTYKARYVPHLFDIATENNPIRRFGRVPGGWKDY